VSGDDRPARVGLLCLDVDGVLTDGTVLIDDLGRETKRFNVRDGAGLKLWARAGFVTAIITGRSSMALRHRADELGIRLIVQGCGDKAAAFAELLEALDLPASRAAVVGDDLPDLPMLRLCGYPVAVADAAPEVRREAAWVTTAAGGRGAVREVVEHLLKAKDRWEELIGGESPAPPPG